jgi:dCTP deaminase
MSFWSSQTLKSRLPELIEPFDVNRIESAAYELRLGGEVYISPLPDTPQKERKKEFIEENGTVPIPPGQFAFLITLEKISVPENAIAFISIKFKPKAKGLINVSGFHVDPGYKGRLIFAVYNAGPSNFHVEYGEQLFSIWFADLDDADDCPRMKNGFDSIPTSIINVPDAVSSLPSLVKRLNELEKKVESYSIRQTFFWAILFPFTLAITLAIVKPLLDKIVTLWFG